MSLEISSELISRRVKAEDKKSDLANLFQMAVSPAFAHSLARIVIDLSTIYAVDRDMIYSLLIINKAGGLIYNREYNEGITRLSSNDYLVLAGTFHG